MQDGLYWLLVWLSQAPRPLATPNPDDLLVQLRIPNKKDFLALTGISPLVHSSPPPFQQDPAVLEESDGSTFYPVQ
jgi:hypothetical protein